MNLYQDSPVRQIGVRYIICQRTKCHAVPVSDNFVLSVYSLQNSAQCVALNPSSQVLLEVC